MTKDPVCGMTIDPAKAAARTELAGSIYYSCFAHCQRTFEADPKKYAGQSSQHKHSGDGCCSS